MVEQEAGGGVGAGGGVSRSGGSGGDISAAGIVLALARCSGACVSGDADGSPDTAALGLASEGLEDLSIEVCGSKE